MPARRAKLRLLLSMSYVAEGPEFLISASCHQVGSRSAIVSAMASFNDVLGLVPQADGTVALETKPEHEIAPGTVHFAVLTTLAEVSAARAVWLPVVPAAVNVQLMRRARPGRLVGTGRAVKVGRSLAFAEGEVTQDGQIVAKATVTFART